MDETFVQIITNQIEVNLQAREENADTNSEQNSNTAPAKEETKEKNGESK